MYGRFEDYPEIVQLRGTLSSDNPRPALDQAVARFLRKLNESPARVLKEIVGKSETLEYTYELGIADGFFFNFIDEKEFARLSEVLRTQTLETFDCLLRIHYRYVAKQGRVSTPQSDQFFVRIEFMTEDSFEIKFHHFKGSRWIPFEDLLRDFVSVLNDSLKAAELRPVVLSGVLGH